MADSKVSHGGRSGCRWRGPRRGGDGGEAGSAKKPTPADLWERAGYLRAAAHDAATVVAAADAYAAADAADAADAEAAAIAAAWWFALVVKERRHAVRAARWRKDLERQEAASREGV